MMSYLVLLVFSWFAPISSIPIVENDQKEYKHYEDLIALIEKKAQIDDEAFFKKYIIDSEIKLITKKILKSNLTQTYKEKLNIHNPQRIQLNYHTNYHYQIILYKTKSWHIDKIYICR